MFLDLLQKSIPVLAALHIDKTVQFYKEMWLASVVYPNGPLTKQPGGMHEFATFDEDGNMIKFGEKVKICW